jgi:hypothetical protein
MTLPVYLLAAFSLQLLEAKGIQGLLEETPEYMTRGPTVTFLQSCFITRAIGSLVATQILKPMLRRAGCSKGINT